MAKKKEEQAAPDMAAALSADPKMEAVKQLIFGENMQQYDSEFSDIRALIKKTRAELENELTETREALTNTINDLRTDMTKKMTQLRSEMDDAVQDLDERKVNRKLLGAMLQEMGQKIAE